MNIYIRKRVDAKNEKALATLAMETRPTKVSTVWDPLPTRLMAVISKPFLVILSHFPLVRMLAADFGFVTGLPRDPSSAHAPVFRVVILRSEG